MRVVHGWSRLVEVIMKLPKVWKESAGGGECEERSVRPLAALR